MRRLQAIVEAANANTLQVGLKPNPGIGYEGQQLGSGGLAEQHGLVISQEIVRGHKLQLNRVVADRERHAYEQEYTAQRLRVLTDVRIAFYQVLLAQRQIQVCDELIKIGTEGSQTVAGLFEAKQVGRGDVLQAQLETENARILAENARIVTTPPGKAWPPSSAIRTCARSRSSVIRCRPPRTSTFAIPAIACLR